MMEIDMERLLKEFKRRVSDELGKVHVILFGSHARASAEKESDIDILVILDKEVDIRVKERVYDIAYDLCLEYDVVLDVSVYSKSEWERYRGVLPFIVNVEREGVIV